jgi:hypothetical protein
MIRKLLLLTIIALLFTLGLVGADRLFNRRVGADLTAMSAADVLYATGQYSESIQIFQQLIDQGVQESSVFYNLGNAYYRLGDYGRAILNYRRASQLNPRDADIKANLELALTMANVEAPEIALGPITLVSNITGNWLTLNEAALLALGLWLLVSFLLISWRLLFPEGPPSSVRFAVVATLILLLLVIMSLGTRTYTESLEPSGVVVAPVVTLRSEPGDEFNTDFEIVAGSSVELIEQQGEWIHLSGPGDTYRGWVPAGTVETIALNQQMHHFRT